MSGFRLGSLFLTLASIGIAGAVLYSLFGEKSGTQVRAAGAGTSDTTASITGPGGLPVPRFVSLKTDLVNVRRGPSSEHEVIWVFRRKGLPVEIIAEFEHWRRIRDSEGEEGWVYQSLLTGKRTALIEPWKKEASVPMRNNPQATASSLAILRSGVIGEVQQCDGTWCKLAVEKYEGWVDQAELYGVYPGEKVEY